MKYALYHIPGKKIGVTNNLKYRVEEQQGYEPGEYEILAWSDDISYISTLEREMQVSTVILLMKNFMRNFLITILKNLIK